MIGSESLNPENLTSILFVKTTVQGSENLCNQIIEAFKIVKFLFKKICFQLIFKGCVISKCKRFEIMTFLGHLNVAFHRVLYTFRSIFN